MTNENIWTIESNLKNKWTPTIATLFAIVGILLLALGNHFLNHPDLALTWRLSRPSATASQHINNISFLRWLGAGLLCLAAAFYFYSAEILVVVDNKHKRIRMDEKSRLGASSKLIDFSEVAQIRVERRNIGKDSPTLGIYGYHLIIRFKNGKRFDTGRASLNEQEIADIATRLANDIGCETWLGPHQYPITASFVIGGIEINQIVLAIIGAVGTYAIWFRVVAGPWCHAMWYGTAPLFIIGFSFVVILGILRRLPRN